MNCPKMGRPEGQMLRMKYRRSKCDIKLTRNENKLALGVTAVLLCLHNLPFNLIQIRGWTPTLGT